MGKKRSTTRRTRRRGARATTRRRDAPSRVAPGDVLLRGRSPSPRLASARRAGSSCATDGASEEWPRRASFFPLSRGKKVGLGGADRQISSLDASPRRTPCARRRGRWRVVLSRPPRRSSSERSRAPSSRGGGRGRVVARRTATTATTASASASRWRATTVGASSGAFYTLVPIRPRSRGERRSLRTFPGVSLRPPLAFNPRPRRLSTPPDAFELHPDKRPSEGSASGS